MGLYLIWQRLRHSRGFGIHSPYAFRFITEVLHQPCRYYAYDSLPDDILNEHEWKLLVRLLVHFRPRTVSLGPGVPSRVGRFLRKVAPRVVFSGAPDLLIGFNEVPPEFTESVHKGKLHAIIFNSKSAPDPQARQQGMVFSNGKSWIMAAHKHLPPQNFEVYF